MANFEVGFYETAEGRVPAEEFIDLQDVKMQAKIFREIGLLAEKGNALEMPHSEHLDEGIFQLRAKVGNEISRVLYFFVVGKKIILTNGFVKKTQKTPPDEIALAKKYRADYLQRKCLK